MPPETKINIPLSLREWSQILMALHRVGSFDLHAKISGTLQLLDLPMENISVRPNLAKE
jgi:hypothetical protein